MSKEDLVGKIVGKYKIVEKIGEGGMGIVYKGIQISLNRPVAMKMLPQNLASDKDFVTRFKQEALSVAKLNHRNIIQVYDTDELEGNYFIIMEYIEGETLDELLKRKKALPLDFTLEILQQVGMALSYAHKHGVVHRDVKPGNIMIAADGSIKVMDFGIAKVQDSSVKTKTGMSIGTPEYMSPEQVKGIGVDSKSDMYAFGVLSYRMLAGELPFKGKDPFATAYKHLHEDVPSPRVKNPKISPETEEMVLKCMKKDKDQRYQDMNDIIHLLKNLLRHSTSTDGKTMAIPEDAGATVMAKDIIKKAKMPIKVIIPAVLLVVVIISIYIVSSPHVVEKPAIDKEKTAEEKLEEIIAKDIEQQKPVIAKKEELEKKKVSEPEEVTKASHLVEVKKKNEEKIKANLIRGKIRFNLGAQNSIEYKLAIKHFETVLELDPDNVEAREYRRLALEGIIKAEIQAKTEVIERAEEKKQKKQKKLAMVDRAKKPVLPFKKEIPIGGLFKFDSIVGKNAQVNFIQGITIDKSDNIYVIDTVGRQNSSVLKLSPKGEVLTSWQSPDIGRPMDIAVDKEGNVYICNIAAYSIKKFNPQGMLIASIGSRGHGNGKLDQPRGVAVDKEGNVYVADTRHYRIQKFDKHGNYLTVWGKRGVGNSQFSYILDVAVDESGNVYALDYKLCNVQKFDSAGNFLLKFGRPGQLSQPRRIAIKNDYVFIANSASNSIQVFDINGNYITKFGSRGGSDGQFNSPTGIAFDSKGYVYVTDSGNKRQFISSRIQKFRPPQ